MRNKATKLISSLMLLLLLVVSFSSNSQLQSSSSFLPPEQAFHLDFYQQGNKIALQWSIAPNYYLYKSSILVESVKSQLEEYQLPASQRYQDSAFGEVDVYSNELFLEIPLRGIQSAARVTVYYRGCARAGFCYPPQQKTFTLSPTENSQTAAEVEYQPQLMPASLPFTPLWAFLLGIGVAFTPCVFPMYPLICAVVLGKQRQKSSYKRATLLSISYVQGMAVFYTLLGVMVATMGASLQLFLQNIWVLFSISAVFVVLALAMLGVFAFNLPARWQTALTALSNQQKQGSVVGAFITGAMAGLVCSPCTTAPLAAILLYIAQYGNLVIGGFSLYLYALGMGIPLLLFALFGQAILPKSGRWMDYIKQAMGIGLLILPVLLLQRVVSEKVGCLLWYFWCLIAIIWVAYLLHQRYIEHRNKIVIGFGLAIILFMLGFFVQWGLFSFYQEETKVTEQSQTQFKSIYLLSELESALVEAKYHAQPVLIDFYAQWCSSCKQLDKEVFSDKQVQAALSHVRLLRIDVTKNSEENRHMMAKFSILGLPAVLFYSSEGEYLPYAQVNGYIKPEGFLVHIGQLPHF